MTELDLGLKVGVRRLLWSMGYSTRIDVELRGERAHSSTGGEGRRAPSARNQRGSAASSGAEAFTDLDVMGVLVPPGFKISTTIADCKSGQRDRPTARMFWARGVADLFAANQVMLVREHDVNDAVRQLSSRLGITVLPSRDLATMQALHGATEDIATGPLRVLFDREYAANYLRAFNGLDRRLNPLLEYRNFDYWVYDHHRNPTQLVAHLRDAANHMDSRNPIHQALFMDLAWLQLLALIRALDYISGAFLHDHDRGLREYLFGGATNLREKQEMAALLRGVAPPGADELGYLPPYYGQLRELITRLIRRPAELQEALRYAEVASALMAAREQVTLGAIFGDTFRPLAAKLLADVCGFLVAAAQLDGGFRSQSRAWLLGERLAGSGKAGHLGSDGSATDESGDGRLRQGSDGSVDARSEVNGGMASNAGEVQTSPGRSVAGSQGELEIDAGHSTGHAPI